MTRRRWTTTAGALRPVLALAALGAVLAGCAADVRPGPRFYGGGYYGGGWPGGFYGPPSYGGGFGRPWGLGRPWGYDRPLGYDRFAGPPRGFYGGGGGGFGYSPPPPPRIQGPGTQDFLRQHWIDQARRLPPP